MKQYRILKKENTLTKDIKYVVQVKSLFWWFTCEKELGWNCSEPAIFNDIEDANDFIKDEMSASYWVTSEISL